MALGANENKVKFGLKKVYYAIATIAEDGSATYETPVSFPGARNLSMDPQGGGEPWYADDGVYYFAPGITSRQGDLEMARMIDSFKKDILGYIADSKGVLLEDMNPEAVHFALLFEVTGDKKRRRYVMYNCTAAAPSLNAATSEGSKEPQTETSTITSDGIYVSGLDKWINHGESTPETDATTYNSWFESVHVPTPPTNPGNNG